MYNSFPGEWGDKLREHGLRIFMPVHHGKEFFVGAWPEPVGVLGGALKTGSISNIAVSLLGVAAVILALLLFRRCKRTRGIKYSPVGYARKTLELELEEFFVDDGGLAQKAE